MRAIISLIITITLLLALTVMQAYAGPQVTNMTGLVYDGIDVSSYQADIDWRATAEDPNIKFVYVKATEGATYRSHHYAYNIENARKHGIKVGSYHFFRPTTPVQKQFENFTSVVKKDDQDLIPLIDVETRRGVTPAQLVDSVLAFAHLLQGHYGCRPMIYTGVSFYNSYLRNHFAGYKLFIARYSRFQPQLVGAQWTLWQFSETGRIAGIDHNVDLCRFNVGCSLRDILMPGRRAGHRRQASQLPPPPPPRRTQIQKTQEQQVPLSKKQKKELERKRKEAEKKAKQQAQLRERQQADSARQAREAQKRAEKARKEEQKRLQKQQELLRKQQEKQAREQAKRDREAQQKAEKQRAKLRLQQQEALEQAQKEQQQKAEQAKKAQQAQKAKQARKAQQQAAAKAKAQRTSANDRAKSQGKRINQSSADNDD